MRMPAHPIRSIRDRLARLGRRLDRHLSRLTPERYVGLRWPGAKPWQAARFELASFGGGLGDELMVTPILREVRTRNPTARILYHSRYPELFGLYPFIDEVIPLKRGTLPATGHIVRYDHLTPPVRPLPIHLAQQVGLLLDRHTPAPPPIPGTVADPAADLPRPRIAIQPGGSGWTPNKQWPLDRWLHLVQGLLPAAHLFELGTAPAFASADLGPRYRCLAGRTSLLEFAAAVRGADLFIGPVSSGLHLAAAFEIPSLAIFGGYEHPDGIGYPRVTPFYSAVPCAPCWLDSGCPHALRCLHGIDPDTVRTAAVRLLSETPAR